jgi:hypothetical protein
MYRSYIRALVELALDVPSPEAYTRTMELIMLAGICSMIIVFIAYGYDEAKDAWHRRKQRLVIEDIRRRNLMAKDKDKNKKDKNKKDKDEAPRDPAQPELIQVLPSREPPPEEQNEHWAFVGIPGNDDDGQGVAE